MPTTPTSLVCIHGGTTFPSYEAYLTYLRTKELTLERLRPHHDWKDELQATLGTHIDVLVPRMPNGHNAQYDEWALWFERIAALLSGDVLLVGHSLGGIFLARYLADTPPPVRVRATFLVAAPFDDRDLGGESLVSFTPPRSYDDLAAHAGHIFLYHSTDDPVVPYGDALRYAAALPHATLRTLEGRGHCTGNDFPELVMDVQSCT